VFEAIATGPAEIDGMRGSCGEALGCTPEQARCAIQLAVQ
jgi:hypothetical protein